MIEKEAKIGTKVRSLVEFADVPKGTTGTIDEDYGKGVMVAWELDKWPKDRPLRDGFDKKDELVFLEVI
jgi:hypothetical protein